MGNYGELMTEEGAEKAYEDEEMFGFCRGLSI